MKPDDFENQLQRRPLRPVPTEWRAEILEAARTAAFPRASLSWREWLWPSPKAWAALAAAWMLIAVLTVMDTPRRAEMAKQTARPSPEAETALAAQRRELARLLEPYTESSPAPKATRPGPRSENFSPPRV
jgi:hypothetical protein